MDERTNTVVVRYAAALAAVGALTVMSRKGIGSVFTVALPVDGASIEQRAPGSFTGS